MDSRIWWNEIQAINSNNAKILSVRNGHWSVKDKISVLKKFTTSFHNSHLDLIKSVSLKILSEVHPMFDLKPEDRFAAEVYGKIPQYSPELRKGMAETLVFLGIHGPALINCTRYKPEDTSASIIREIFTDADWKLWASLNDLLPTLAEASPTEFLAAVQNALRKNPCPFDELYSQEGPGISFGYNYMTGLYWALETLAWSEEHLSTTILILAELATHDPGGNWANRPDNSIVTILLPWLPQTIAPIEKRIAAIKGMQRNFPEIAWKTLIRLLPNQMQTSSGSHKPTFRRYIPKEWKKGTSKFEYWKQVREYASIAVAMSKTTVNYVADLVNNIDNIPQPSLDEFVDYLLSDDIANLPDEQKLKLWETMILFIKKHRRFSDAKWALPNETVDRLERTLKKLEPVNPEILYRYWFSDNNHDFLYENVDWRTHEEKMLHKRIDALTYLYEMGMTELIIRFSENVENPAMVGDSFAHIANKEIDKELLPSFLETKEIVKNKFISGYIRKRYFLNGPTWIDALQTEKWNNPQKLNLLFNLPFENEIWEKAQELLGQNVGDYWKGISAHPLSTQSALLPAIENLLKYSRPRLAFECIYAHFFSKKELYKEQAIKALLDGVASDEHKKSIDTYEIREIIKILQDDPQVNDDDLFKLEWAYLPLLEEYHNAEPKLLVKYLSQKPEFFIELIRLMYRSKNDDLKEKKDTGQSKGFAENAWKLLRDWKRPPGKMDDGSFSPEALKKWVDKVKTKTIESGHYEVAMHHLGNVLYYTEPDPNGLWIHQAVAELLDSSDADDIRQGFRLEIFNSRGVHWVDPTGKPEKELTDLWRKNADEVEKSGFIRFASSLKEVANSYDREADRVKSNSFHEQENETTEDENDDE